MILSCTGSMLSSCSLQRIDVRVKSFRTRAGQAIDKETILAHPCDVLIPAAIGGVLDEDTAKDVQVRLALHVTQG